MINKEIKSYKKALMRKALDADLTLEEYLNTDDVVILEGGSDFPIHWDGDDYDFVVYGKEPENWADEIGEDDVVKPMVDWLIENNII